MTLVFKLRLPTSTALSCVLVMFIRIDATFGQNTTLRSGTAARAQLIKRSTVHSGQQLSAKLMDSIYLGDKLALSAGTLLQGNIIDLTADRMRRI